MPCYEDKRTDDRWILGFSEDDADKNPSLWRKSIQTFSVMDGSNEIHSILALISNLQSNDIHRYFQETFDQFWTGAKSRHAPRW